MTEKIPKKYDGEWRISTPAKPTAFNYIVTPSFKPLHYDSIAFRFEAFYQQIRSLSLFKLKLVKLVSSASISAAFTVKVKVFYSDGSIFKEYETLSYADVDNMIEQHSYEDRIREVTSSAGLTTHGVKMRNETLVIKCQMIFYHHDQPPQVASCTEKQSINRYLDFNRNLKLMYQPCTLSDIVFQVGDKSFPAHKFVLAAHSPVFKKMMTLEFLESKTNNVIITDATPEIFDSFLRSLYSGELSADKPWNSLKEIYRLADKYDVGFLKKECTETMNSLLSVDLVCEILQLAYAYSDADLKTAAVSYAVNHIKEIVPREDWNELVKCNSLIGYEVTFNFIPK